MGGRAFIPICTLCDFDTKKMFLFLVIAAFNFKTCLKAGIWDPCFLKRSESCKAKCILLLRCLLFRMEWVSALRLPPGHLPDRLYIVFILFSPCCPTRLTRVCSTSNNIYHLVRQPTATNVMKRFSCYSTEAPVLWTIWEKCIDYTVFFIISTSQILSQTRWSYSGQENWSSCDKSGLGCRSLEE